MIIDYRCEKAIYNFVTKAHVDSPFSISYNMQVSLVYVRRVTALHLNHKRDDSFIHIYVFSKTPYFQPSGLFRRFCIFHIQAH